MVQLFVLILQMSVLMIALKVVQSSSPGQLATTHTQPGEYGKLHYFIVGLFSVHANL